MSEPSLEERVTRLEDQHAIQQLRARYCQYLDDGHWEELTTLFTIDGAFIGLSTARGREEMLDFFPRLNATSVTSWWHFSSNETVEITGHEATGATWLLQPCVVDGEAQRAAGRYEDKMVKNDAGTWLFTERKVSFFFWGPLDQGWDAGSFGWDPAKAAADPRTMQRLAAR
jgi:DNA-binding Lrp family transcriptional regulator